MLRNLGLQAVPLHGQMSQVNRFFNRRHRNQLLTRSDSNSLSIDLEAVTLIVFSPEVGELFAGVIFQD